MRMLLVGTVMAVLAGGLSDSAPLSGGAAAQGPATRPLVTPAEYERWQVELSNWGRWGKDDEMGTLNLISAAKRKAAAALVHEGFTVSLASNASTEKGPDVPCPVEWAMVTATEANAADRIGYPCIHGAGTTHLDSFAHRFFNGKMWNGYPVAELVTLNGGAAKNSILTMKQGIVTRGVLYDIPRLKGVPYLEPGTAIYQEDVEAWEKMSGVKIASGDAILLRTGRWARREKMGPWPVGRSAAGFHASIIPFIKARGVSIVGSDDAAEVTPTLVAGVNLPVHTLLITALGINILDNQDLEALAETAAKLKRWEFMITINPMPVTGGTGSPMNTLATF